MNGQPGHFVSNGETIGEYNDWTFNDWMCRPGMVPTTRLLMVRATLEPGCCHPFHLHPHREEIIHVVSGILEQWVGRTCRVLHAGEIAFIPAGIPHGAYNPSGAAVVFHAILSPAVLDETEASDADPVDVSMLSPWVTIRDGLPPCGIFRDLPKT